MKVQVLGTGCAKCNKLYAEVENLASESTLQGAHTALQSRYQIYDVRGQRVADHSFTKTEEHCQKPRRDFFIGYLKDDEATEAAWLDGWFHTGDVVRRSAEGDFHFVDRRKNVIRRSGENISALEVESVLNQHPAVAACGAAVGS